jgi:S1-C subfamily serine protease
VRWAAALLATVLAAGGCAPVAVPADRADVLRRILPSTVQLRAEREGGGRRSASGVVIAADERGSWILTARHFLEPARPQSITVSAPGRGARAKARVSAVSPEHDIAVIRVDGIVFPPIQLKDGARLGDEVWVVGFPWGRRLTLVSGIVSQIESDESEVAVEGPARLIDASVSYGASGGGVFDAVTGALIGIVESYRTARLTLPTTPERAVDIPVPGETTVVSARAIRRFLEAAGLPDLLAR